MLTARERGSANWLSLKKARNQLGVSEPVFTVLIRRGLLGYTLSGMVSDQAILSYERFGTQWSIDERCSPTSRVVVDDIYESLPAIESICPQPPATQTHMRAARPTAHQLACSRTRRRST